MLSQKSRLETITEKKRGEEKSGVLGKLAASVTNDCCGRYLRARAGVLVLSLHTGACYSQDTKSMLCLDPDERNSSNGSVRWVSFWRRSVFQDRLFSFLFAKRLTAAACGRMYDGAYSKSTYVLKVSVESSLLRETSASGAVRSGNCPSGSPFLPLLAPDDGTEGSTNPVALFITVSALQICVKVNKYMSILCMSGIVLGTFENTKYVCHCVCPQERRTRTHEKIQE